MTHSKTKTSYYRRLYIAYLIDTGISTVPQIMSETAMPRRTVQDTIKSLSELDIICNFVGATKDGSYVIPDWGAINRKWIKTNLQHVNGVLKCGC
ncbi:helix-turn-helix domain-containing protein [Shewanella frigidimarina]|uniref:helix-turn-helix domain-containing protein n=1 Tax=Shewanella frigidimarina TaxID=56812 RepID=UPI003D78E816